VEKTYEDGKRDGKVEALEERVNGIEVDIQGLAKTLRDEFVERIDPISRALLGNGDPQKGLASRFLVVSNMVKTNRWLIALLLAALVGVSMRVLIFA